MTIREQMEQRELEYLSPYAAKSINKEGRDRKQAPCNIRPVYQRDRDRILHCKAFRRLKQKTQVFLMPKGDHYRTRLTHTLEVSQNARTIAKALRLNEDLTEAIALGHDLGHTPYGHAGERALNQVCPHGFRHNEQSVRVVEVLENQGEGLNLTKEVRDGILNHKTAGRPSTLEGQIVRLSDKIAYIAHDTDDAIRGGILTTDEYDDPRCDHTEYGAAGNPDVGGDRGGNCRASQVYVCRGLPESAGEGGRTEGGASGRTALPVLHRESCSASGKVPGTDRAGRGRKGAACL